ncbi:MAG: HAD hydrolase family protein [Acutalibacteraceae bacterium]|nr:HAD hydrolase family protein [Acutalibacteraceae bacterium]
MIIFNTDLDNTIIYSYKQDIGKEKINVEIYQGREISFITPKTFQLLQKLNEKVLIVPTTTRTLEQYSRIDLGLGTFKYALACNGGVLLENGVENMEWYNTSREMVDNSQEQLNKSMELFENDPNRTFEVRNLRELFVFTKSSTPKETVEMLKSQLDTSILDIFYNGVKVYAVPKILNKGNSVKRLQKMLGAEKIITAGDSEFDIPMLNVADFSLAPNKLVGISRECGLPLNSNVEIMPENMLFSESLLHRILEYLGE